MALDSIREYRGHRLVPHPMKEFFRCSYCGEQVQKEAYWNGVREAEAGIECKVNPSYKRRKP